MSEITISTNGTVEATKLIVDGKEVTKKEKVVSINLYASAPYKSSYDNETYPGNVMVSYTVAKEDGTVERKAIYNEKDSSAGGIGTKIESSDQVIQFMGNLADQATVSIVDKIISHCTEKEIVCPDREVLLSRSIESLTDKASDLGLLEDNKSEEEKPAEEA
jgi:hypothetical protein